jgi:large subunit ribosomal protein L15
MNRDDILAAGPPRKKRKRVGRGIGSGRGKTCTRGTKGYGSRSGAGGKLGHEGGQMPLYRRLPRRGFNNSRFRVEYTAINVGQLDKACQSGAKVTLASLQEAGLVKKNARRVKVLGFGEIGKVLHIEVDACSAQARAKIEAASGTVEMAKPQKKSRKDKEGATSNS